MSTMDNTTNVQEQYKDDNNLSIRMKLHAKHSTNKQGLVPWLFEKYEFSKGHRILELGCGNGEQWQNRIQQLPEDCVLILSDFSEGMVKNVWEKYSNNKNFFAIKIDIQNIPFHDGCFDIVIANHMLYHVPDLSIAISEVKRILKPGGIFYATTNGIGGMRPFLHNAFKRVNPSINAFSKTFSFNLQNGKEILSRYFDDVQRFDFVDSLSISETQDLIDWLKSTVTMASYSESDIDGLYEYFEGIRQKEGAINIPKEAGLFISTKQKSITIGNEDYSKPQITRIESKDKPNTDKIKLIPVEAIHIDEINKMYEDSITREMQGIVSPPDIDYFTDKNNKCYVILGEKGEFVGTVELFNISWKNRRAEYSITISSSHRGKGYGYDATRKILDMGFHQLGLNRIWLRVLEYNNKAIGLYEKVGFIKEGICRDESLRKGKFVNQIQMSILRREWV